MARYKIITLVDITRANPDRKETDKLKLGQQANFNSLLQAIGLRANVYWESDPRQHSGSLPLPMIGKARHWTWEFDVELDDVFKREDDPVGLLKEDLNGVPVINGLNESVDINPSAFKTLGDNANTYIQII
jgi:hypothetical protein